MNGFRPGDSKYYTKRHKVIRDLVHEYIHLTAFEISIIDNRYFQRLRDIKQVTADFVFPNANHTRFEHSLGTFELTRMALKAINENGLFINHNGTYKIHPNLEFSTLIAALLHDIGHCPFSHLGEKEFDKNELHKRLTDGLSGLLNERNSPLLDEDTIKLLSKSGANHEKLSCIIIIEKLWDRLKNCTYHEAENDNEVRLDLQHICRCILGVPYDESIKGAPSYISKSKESLRIANFCVHLVNSDVFDMDSLDYIMRDTMYCALSGSKIDTQRLFSSMYISEDGRPAFKRQAISVLKSIIDAKNNDYLYAVNHHSTLYSNFMYRFIFRRFKNDDLFGKYSFFTADDVINNFVSDCDVLAMLKEKEREFSNMLTTQAIPEREQDIKINRAHNLLSNLLCREF